MDLNDAFFGGFCEELEKIGLNIKGSMSAAASRIGRGAKRYGQLLSGSKARVYRRGYMRQAFGQGKRYGFERATTPGRKMISEMGKAEEAGKGRFGQALAGMKGFRKGFKAYKKRVQSSPRYKAMAREGRKVMGARALTGLGVVGAGVAAKKMMGKKKEKKEE